jgi:soluble lytic murein transglycosylase
MYNLKHKANVLPVILALVCTGLVSGTVGGSQDPESISPAVEAYRPKAPAALAPARPEPKPVRKVSRRERYENKVKGQIAGVIANFDTGLTAAQNEQLPQWIFDESRKHGYDPLFLTGLIITESTFNNWAKSPAGALGLMQIRPRTGRYLAGELNIPWHGPKTLYNPQVNLALGAYYLKKLVHRFGDLSLALEAYNHGPTRLAKYLKKGRQPRLYSSRVFDFYSEIRFQKPGPRLIFANFPQEGDDISYWMPDMDFEEIGPAAIEESDVAPPLDQKLEQGKPADPAAEGPTEQPGAQKVVESYGPIAAGETLFKIVEKLGYSNKDAPRAVVALWMDNRSRFVRQNLNGLRVGAILDIKHLKRTTERLSGVVASRVLKSQWAEWKGDIPPGRPIVITQLAELELKKPVFTPTPIAEPAAANTPAPEAPTQATVKPGDTLYGIAEHLGYSGRDASRVAVALWMENRGKFIDGNLHGLRIGENLDLVNLEQRRNELDSPSAQRIIDGQWKDWVARES